MVMDEIEILERDERYRDTDADYAIVNYTVKVLGSTYTVSGVEIPTLGFIKSEEDEIIYIMSELLKKVEKLNKIKKLLA